MSATGRGREREPEDFYSTPSWCVRRLFEAWHPIGGMWMEPGAGNGAIIKATNAIDGLPDHQWAAFEIREEERETLHALCAAVGIGDFLGMSGEPLGPRIVSTVIGNPPYRLAQEFIEQSRRLAPCAEIAFLLRLNFLASKERCPFMQANPPDVYVLPNRPSFTGEGTDSPEYAWFVWPPPVDAALERRTRGTIQVLNLTSIKERKRDVGHNVLIESPQRELFG